GPEGARTRAAAAARTADLTARCRQLERALARLAPALPPRAAIRLAAGRGAAPAPQVRAAPPVRFAIAPAPRPRRGFSYRRALPGRRQSHVDVRLSPPPGAGHPAARTAGARHRGAPPARSRCGGRGIPGTGAPTVRDGFSARSPEFRRLCGTRRP